MIPYAIAGIKELNAKVNNIKSLGFSLDNNGNLKQEILNDVDVKIAGMKEELKQEIKSEILNEIREMPLKNKFQLLW